MTGHGLGGAYAQLLHLVLLAQHAAEHGSGHAKKKTATAAAGGPPPLPPPPPPACLVVGAPPVVASDPLGRVAALLATGGRGYLVNLVFGHDLVPRLMAAPPRDPASFSSQEQLQLRRIHQ